MSFGILKKKRNAWFFTLNNPEAWPLDLDTWRRKPVYLVYQLEVGEEGTPHLQGYAYFEKQILGSTFSGYFLKKPHLAFWRGSHDEVSQKKKLFLFVFLCLLG